MGLGRLYSLSPTPHPQIVTLVFRDVTIQCYGKGNTFALNRTFFIRSYIFRDSSKCLWFERSITIKMSNVRSLLLFLSAITGKSQFSLCVYLFTICRYACIRRSLRKLSFILKRMIFVDVISVPIYSWQQGASCTMTMIFWCMCAHASVCELYFFWLYSDKPIWIVLKCTVWIVLKCTVWIVLKYWNAQFG